MLTSKEILSVIDIVAKATPLNVFNYVTFVVKVMVIITICLGGATLIVLLRRPKGNYSKSLTALGGWALGISLFGAAYSGLNSYLGFAGGSNPYSYNEIVPAIIAVVYVLILGLLIWAISLWGNAGARRV